jgi:hypothetical protein
LANSSCLTNSSCLANASCLTSTAYLASTSSLAYPSYNVLIAQASQQPFAPSSAWERRKKSAGNWQ